MVSVPSFVRFLSVLSRLSVNVGASKFGGLNSVKMEWFLIYRS